MYHQFAIDQSGDCCDNGLISEKSGPPGFQTGVWAMALTSRSDGVSGIGETIGGTMFDFYSERARQILFLARVESGARGAEMLDVDDLLVSLIMEDQGIRSQALLELMHASDPSQLPFEPHTAFLPAEGAARVIEEIQNASPHRQPISVSADMSISPALSIVLGVANDLQQKFQSKQVTPLHLLAAVLAGSTKGVLSLRDAGITQETVIDAIRKEEER